MTSTDKEIKRTFTKVLKRYTEVGNQGLQCAANIYKTGNRVRTFRGTEYMADVERATKRVLNPQQWSIWCNVALREANRPHGNIPAADYGTIVELCSRAYVKAGLLPHLYFRVVRRRLP